VELLVNDDEISSLIQHLCLAGYDQFYPIFKE